MDKGIDGGAYTMIRGFKRIIRRASGKFHVRPSCGVFAGGVNRPISMMECLD